jgi:starch-binding outer membrane protein, SusD/RagB family
MHRYITGASASRAFLQPIRLAAIASAAFLIACSTDKLTEVATPDQITPEQANSATGAAALRTSALGNFANFFAGDNAGNGVGMNIATGLLGDEMISARGGTEHLDSRAVNEAVFPATVWSTFGQANTQIIRALRAVKEFAPEGATKVSQVAQLYMLEGFTYVIVAEGYCNGIPVGNADEPTPTTEILSNADLFNKAIAYFDSALTTAAATDTKIRNAALVGRARALVDFKRYADAATAVAAVPTDYVYNVEFSTTTIVNDVYDWMLATPNFGPADKEGRNGLDYVTSKDPRVKVDASTTRPGQDGTRIWLTQQYPRGDSPVPLATGIEARLIEAENLLATNNASGWLGKLNAARTTVAGLTPLTDPGSTAARVDLLFRERAFWMYFTSHRVGDLRRLVRQYGRAPESVWPTGTYFKGGVYGADQNLPPSQAERNNPEYPGCTDRSA